MSHVYEYLKKHLPVVLFCIVMCVVWAYLGLYPARNFDSSEQAGQFGDSFGFATSLFSSFGFIAGMVALIMQIVEQGESGKRDTEIQGIRKEQLNVAQSTAKLQREIQEHQRSQVVLDCLVSINTESANLRESWIDISTKAVYSNPERAKLESARQRLKTSAFTASMLFYEQGKNLEHLIQSMLEIAAERDTPDTSPLVDWFDVIRNEVLHLTEALWRVQPGNTMPEFTYRRPDNVLGVIGLDNFFREFRTLYNRYRSAVAKYLDSLNPDIQHENVKDNTPELRSKYLKQLGPDNRRKIPISVIASDPQIKSLAVEWEGLPDKWFGLKSDDGPDDNSLTELDELLARTVETLKKSANPPPTNIPLQPSDKQGSA